jgi:hypothetical protein
MNELSADWDTRKELHRRIPCTKTKEDRQEEQNGSGTRKAPELAPKQEGIQGNQQKPAKTRRKGTKRTEESKPGRGRRVRV